jgi:S1-C subfamily serine protease
MHMPQVNAAGGYRVVMKLMLGCLLTACHPRKSDSHAQYQAARKSAFTVIVQKQGPDGVYPYGGSGVLIDAKKRLILTAAHNVADRVNDAAVLCLYVVDAQPSSQIMPEDLPAFNTPRNYCAVRRMDTASDLALLQFQDALPAGAKAVEIAMEPVRVGDIVFGVASPIQVPNFWFQGEVNSHLGYINIDKGPKFVYDGLFSFRGSLTRGASGGMVLNQDHKLAGIIIAEVFSTDSLIAIGSRRIRDILP